MILAVPELGFDAIEQQAQLLIDDYWRESKNHQRTNQTPVESIAEHHLGYEIEVTNQGLFTDPDLLGGIIFEDYKILINNSIEDHDGRFSFTVAHEIGHHILHRSLYFDNKPDDDSQIICRDVAEKPLIEKQADQFAAALLMPADIIRHAFQKLDHRSVKTSGQAIAICRKLIEVTDIRNASLSAMINRLIELELISSSIPHQSGKGIRSSRKLPWYFRLTYPLYKRLRK